MKEKIKQYITVSAIPLFLAAATIGIFILSKGYRFDFTNREIEGTGVISVETTPKRAYVTIDEDVKGRSPRNVGGLEEGSHTVLVTKDGYYDWEIDVELKAEQLIPLEVSLFLKEPTSQIIFPEQAADGDQETTTASTDEIDKVFVDRENQVVIFTVKKTAADSGESDANKGQNSQSLEVWSYPAAQQFWDFGVRPQLIAELDQEPFTSLLQSDSSDDYYINISPDGKKMLLRFLNTSTKLYNFYILETNNPATELRKIDLLENYGEVLPTWSNDSLHLLFSKQGELRSYNVDTQTQTFVTSSIRKPNTDSKFIFTTDESGYIYFPEKSDLEESVTFSIVRTEPNGGNKTTLISELKWSGLMDIRVTPDNDRIVLFTTEKIVFYYLDSEETDEFSANSPRFLRFSPEEDSYIYMDENETQLKLMRFDVEENNPLHETGIQTLLELDEDSEYTNFTWHPKSKNVLYTKITEMPVTASTDSTGTSTDTEGTPQTHTFYEIHTVDTDNLQDYKIFDGVNYQAFAVGSSGTYLIGRCSDGTLCEIAISENSML